MAKANKVEVVTCHVHLDLSLEEAQVIFDIANRIAGSPENSRRGLVDTIRHSLYPIVGVTLDMSDMEVTETGLRFRNRS